MPEKDSEILNKDPYLKRVVNALIEHYHPLEIYLFGSRARGEEGPNSDYDILVVVKDKVSRAHKNKFQELRWKLGLTQATDVVVFSEEGFRNRTQVKTSLPSTVKEEGTLLYAA